MTYAPQQPLDVPPYQIQQLIDSVADEFSAGFGSGQSPIHVRCAQALGSEIYIGCANGELLRFALQADDPEKLESYRILTRQTVPDEKPVDEIIVIPSLSRALVLSDKQIHFYKLPSLDPMPIHPIRHVMGVAVDQQHVNRPPPSPSGPSGPILPVEFCVLKRTSIVLYSLSEIRLFMRKDFPCPQGALAARRTGQTLCLADAENYNIVDLASASLFPIIPLSQAADGLAIQPSITVIGENEFLVLSWLGTNTLGVFINSNGEPIRGTLEWPSYPDAVCLDYPYIAALLPNSTIEIHSIETLSIVQVISAPFTFNTPASDQDQELQKRLNLVAALGGYLVPSSQRSDKMRMTKVPLLRRFATQSES
ncbi:hypothetical protein AX16_005716 [Volvariella volvacea WC 439]|nr:hypothetical protein AX16_005716 [Volvariella volvacea WC 439]